MNNFFGPHLMIDLQKCNNKLLANKSLIYNLLLNMPGNIGMTRISEPDVFYYTGRIPEDHGVTGVVVLAESHCSIHTFQEKGYCFVDIFSCKDFKISKAVELVKNTFESKEFKYNIVHRGKNFPR